MLGGPRPGPDRLVGEAIAGRRDEVVLATKFGIVRPVGTTPDQALANATINGRPECVRAACDASLARLGVDHIDLYYQHRADPETPIEETVGAMSSSSRPARCARFMGENFQRNLDLVATVERLAAANELTPSQLALAWVLSHGDDIIPIPGTRY